MDETACCETGSHVAQGGLKIVIFLPQPSRGLGVQACATPTKEETYQQQTQTPGFGYREEEERRMPHREGGLERYSE